MSLAAVVEFCVSHPQSTQCALFASVLLSLWFAERISKAQPALQKLRHTALNALYMSAVLPIQLSLMLPCLAIAAWTTKEHWGLIYLLPNFQNPFIKYGLMFLALDFLDYVYHFIAHQFPPLWRLHLLHHTDEAVDVSTTFREHPGETFVRVCFLMLWVFICGASVEIIIIRQTVETFLNLSQHTQFRLPRAWARSMGWLFITPNLHHAHHHFERPGTNCNYGDVFSIWDRLFGTHLDLDHVETVFGLDTHMGRNTDRFVSRVLSSLVSFGQRFARADTVIFPALSTKPVCAKKIDDLVDGGHLKAAAVSSV
jgi:sterol desaturase/sphingolipid hydroxylase (fatty acid hydroxylase superfamily)